MRKLQVELQRLEHAILYARLGTRGRLTAHEEAVRDFGLRFFDFLLPGEARSLYYECRRVAEFEGKGVRVKLLMHVPQLAAMPWEFLFDPRRRDYLALDPYTPIVRYPELAQRTTPCRYCCSITSSLAAGALGARLRRRTWSGLIFFLLILSIYPTLFLFDKFAFRLTCHE